jgi:hypothetical protein
MNRLICDLASSAPNFPSAIITFNYTLAIKPTSLAF